ncbi:MAG: hypothetical protein R2844_21065 [Caldilineales bacterium]
MNELVFNGINAVTGGYLTPPTTAERLLDDAIDEPLDKGHTADLKDVGGDHLIVAEDPRQLDRVGWAVITAADDPDAEAALKQLQPLLDLRREMAGELSREFKYKAGETNNRFTARYGKSAGPVSPDKVPFYLLIVGSPEAIPYHFQYAMDVQYAVGRIHFDTPQEYANYALSVVAAETGGIRLPRSAAFLAVSRDQATQQSASFLVKPLTEWMAGNASDWTTSHIAGDAATKARLVNLHGGSESPAFLFAASHGITFPANHPDQRRRQGALICADWPGPDEWVDKPLPPEFYFGADDVANDAHLAGLISFTFACYGAGTPREDDFDQLRLQKFTQLAERPFVAGLPTRLLGHPNGGALAAIGHVDRTWGYSFLTAENRRETEVFTSMLNWLMQGYPVGAAMEFFGSRYAELGNELLPELTRAQEIEKKIRNPEFVGLLTAHMDSRSYVIVGDPAVRLAVGSGDGETVEAPIVVASQPAAAADQPAAPIPTADQPDAAVSPETLMARLTESITRLDAAERQRRAAMDEVLATLHELAAALGQR